MNRINKMVLAVIMLSVIGYQGSGYSATAGGTIRKVNVSDFTDSADVVTSEIIKEFYLDYNEAMAFSNCCKMMNCEVTEDVRGNGYWEMTCDCSKNVNGDRAGRDASTVSYYEDIVEECFQESR